LETKLKQKMNEKYGRRLGSAPDPTKWTDQSVLVGF